MIIGISGKFCSGKDTVADRLVKVHGFERKAFADKLKEVCADLFGMTTKDRALLQAVGVKMREVRPDVWVDYVLRQIKPDQNVVIPDVRFKNEYDALMKAGARMVRTTADTTVRCDRHYALYGAYPTMTQIDHISETDLDRRQFDAIIDTGVLPLDTQNERIDYIYHLFKRSA